MLPDWDQRIPGLPQSGVTHTVHFATVIESGTALLGAGMEASVSDGSQLLAVGSGVFGATTGSVSIVAHIGADAPTPMGVERFGDHGP